MASTSISLVDSILSGLTKEMATATTSATTAAPADRAPILLLFDVDGTLSKPRLKAEAFMWDLLREAKSKVWVGIVGGSDYVKQQEQLESENGEIKTFFDFVFSENGLVAFEKGESINDHGLKKELSEDEIQEFVNFCLRYIADLKIPVKRGTFVEFRTGMINVSPVGRNCTQAEREAFYEYDKEHSIRPKMIAEFYEKFPKLGAKLKCSIGGQISFDVFPHGWDKTYCLKFVEKKGFKEIHFFGDKTYEGGNDFEIFHDERTIGHTVTSPEQTVEFVREILDKLK
jgi:phosphomannomutase